MSMENLISEAIKQVPDLVVLCFIVKVFLKQMSETRLEYIKSIDQNQREHIEARSATRDVVRENTIALVKLTGAVEALQREATATSKILEHK